MDIVEDFIKTFGEKTYQEVMSHAGVHSLNPVPSSTEERLVFALLEMIDFNCFKYGDVPEGLTREETIKFLKKHRTKILDMKMYPPSYLGLLAGAYNFLWENDSDE